MLGFYTTMSLKEIKEIYGTEEFEIEGPAQYITPSSDQYFRLKHRKCALTYLIPQTWRLDGMGGPLDPRNPIELPHSEEILPSLHTYVHAKATLIYLEFGRLYRYRGNLEFEPTDLETATHFVMTCRNDYAKSGAFDLPESEIAKLQAVEHYQYAPLDGLYDEDNVFIIPLSQDDSVQAFCINLAAQQQKQRLADFQQLSHYRNAVIPQFKPIFEKISDIITDHGKYACSYGEYGIVIADDQLIDYRCEHGKPPYCSYTTEDLTDLLNYVTHRRNG